MSQPISTRLIPKKKNAGKHKASGSAPTTPARKTGVPPPVNPTEMDMLQKQRDIFF